MPKPVITTLLSIFSSNFINVILSETKNLAIGLGKKHCEMFHFVQHDKLMQLIFLDIIT